MVFPVPANRAYAILNLMIAIPFQHPRLFINHIGLHDLMNKQKGPGY